MKIAYMLAAIVGAGVLGGTIKFFRSEIGDFVSQMPVITVEAAYARPYRRSVRRTARRTSRRVTRRTYYRRSIAGCAFRAPYYYCGGIYYRGVVQDGATVYVVVNP